MKSRLSHGSRSSEPAPSPDPAISREQDKSLSGLSHGLRTPLNLVLLLASDGAANPDLPASVRADFESICKHVDLAARLIDERLASTAIPRGKVPAEMSAIRLHAPLKDALSLLRSEIEAKRLAIDVVLDERESTVWGDEARLQQLFWSVLKNAVEFTPESGRVTVRTAHDAARGLVVVTISDTGIGLTPDEQVHIFESPAQGERAGREGPGLGLGLAISRMLVEMHSGHIRVASAGRDQGSTFTIELPLDEASARRDGSGPAWPLTSAPLVGLSKPVRRRRLLLVEDHAPTRHTLTRLFGRRHYEVLAAASVAEARKLGAGGNFQLVISDIGLPDGDGYELMAGLRALHPGLSGIAISGYGMEEDIARSREAGFVEHLIKPVNIAALEAAIDRILEPSADPID